jgi:multiple sugar transport system substrate-binding protein
MKKHAFLASLVALVIASMAVAQTSVTIWHMEQPPHRVERFNELAAEFSAANPEYDVTMEVRDWNTVYQNLAVAAASGNQPDGLFVIPDFALTVRELGIGQPVTELVNALDAQHTFVEAATAAYFDEGEHWAVPLYGMEQVLWYRKDKFREAGIEPPTTWSELLAAARALTGDGQYGIAVPAGRNLASDQVIYSIMLTGGAGSLFDEQCNPTFDTPETVAAFQLYGDLLEVSPPDATSFSWGEPQALFNAGTTAMAIEKGQYLTPWEEESGLPASELGMVRIPVADEGGQEGTIYYSNAAMVLADDPEAQEAVEAFLSYLLEPDVYGRFLGAEPGLFFPLTQSGLESETLWENPVVATYRDYVEEMIAYSEYGALFGFTGGYVCDEIIAVSSQNLLAQTVQQMAGGMSAAEAVAWGQERMEEAVAEFRDSD